MFRASAASCRLPETLERALDQVAFLRLEIEAVVRRTRSASARPLAAVRGPDAGAVCKDDGAFDRVLELADVAGPP